MLKVWKLSFLLCCASGFSELTQYTEEQFKVSKAACVKSMQSSKKNRLDPTYQMARAIRTIQGSDADYIPKVAYAGEIFDDSEFGSYQLMHNGVKVSLNGYYDSQWLTDVIYALKGHHEPQEEKCFHEILQYIPENGVMLELGSYWAYYSLWFSSVIPNAKNYLIEPDPERLELGRKNFALNRKKGHFHRGFCGEIVDTDPNISGTQLILLDEFLDEEQIDHVHILHADIQGGEYKMLLSLERRLKDIDYLFISTHGGGAIHSLCLNFLCSQGFLIVAEHSEKESCSGDGLIVAKRFGVVGPEYIAIQKY